MAMGGVISQTEFRIVKWIREASRTSGDAQGQHIESSIIRPAIERARKRAEELLRASPYADDQVVLAEVLEQFDLITEEGTRRQVGGLATQLSANLAMANKLRSQSNTRRNNTLVIGIPSLALGAVIFSQITYDVFDVLIVVAVLFLGVLILSLIHI